MRIAILTWGTRSDVQPYAALAHELSRRGHDPVLAVNASHVAWLELMGLAVARLPFDVQALMDGAEARRWLAAGNTVAFLRWLGALERGARAAIEDALLAATDGADATVATFLLSHRAAVIAEARRVPFARVHGLPVAPTAEYPSPFLYNGMPLRRASPALILAVAQRGQRPELDDWLTAGPPPAFFGFGSMPVLDAPCPPPEATQQLNVCKSAHGPRPVVSSLRSIASSLFP
jgi:UDP:flavonoid glycosyltransferase YjiC (YdhE family)